MRILFLAYCTLLVSCANGSSSGQDPWVSFLGAPSLENERHLLNSIKDDLERCDWGNAENQSAVPDRFRQELFALIASGDMSSLRVGVNIEKCLDGGDLGDFRRSTGQFFDLKPNALVVEALKLGVSPDRFSALISRLPLELADNPGGQARLVKSRRIKLKEALASANSDRYARSVDALNAIQQSLPNFEEPD